MELTADKIIRVFRGDREIDPENLKKVQEGFDERGYIKLRSLERILFGSKLLPGVEGTEVDNVLIITSDGEIALTKGLIVLDAPSHQLVTKEFEMQILIYNSTPFLNKIEKGSNIARMSRL